jgi:Glycosyltransferase family 87
VEHARDHKPARARALACALLGAWGWWLLGPLYLSALEPGAGEVADFYQDWGSARNHQVGQPVYTPHSLSIPRHLGLPHNPNPSIEYNAHPPGAVLLVMPLARLTYRDAFLVWNLVSLAALVASMVIVAVALPAPRSWFWPFWAFLPFCQPLYANIAQGQLTLILLLLTTAAWSRERSGWGTSAGVLLGVAAAIKLFPAYLLVYFVAKGRFRVLLAAVLGFIVWNGTSAMVLGLDAYRDYIHVVMPRMEVFRGFGYNLSIAGFWHKLFDPVGERNWIAVLWPSPSMARAGSLISILAMTAVVALLSYRARTAAQRDLAFSAAATGMLLASPVTWVYSLILLLVPLAVLARTAGRPGGIAAGTLAAVMGILSVPQETWTYMSLGEAPTTVTPLFILGAASVKFYAILAIFAMLIFSASRDQTDLDIGQTEVH